MKEGLSIMALLIVVVGIGWFAMTNMPSSTDDTQPAMAATTSTVDDEARGEVPPPPLLHLCFVDVSPPKFSPQQARDVRTLLDGTFHDLRVGEQLQLHASIHGQVSSMPEPLADVMGVPRSQAELPPGAPAATDEYLSMEPDRLYRREMLPAIEEIMDVETPLAQESPIFGYITVYSDILSKSDAARKRITVISDLVNNSLGLDQYRQGFQFERFRETPKYKREKPDLTGVEVHIYLLQRGFREFSDDDIIEFWEALVRDCGATDITIRVLRQGVE